MTTSNYQKSRQILDALVRESMAGVSNVNAP
jgi:hypothetical protein